ncbi:hypothetical protein PO124_33690 [Bacillus licheniformis]|nr:hypothetical protein [Bacillus licheniformis]
MHYTGMSAATLSWLTALTQAMKESIPLNWAL